MQSPMFEHSRSDVAVGGRVSTCTLASQVENSEHCLSLVAVGAALSNVVDVQTLNGVQTRSDVTVPAVLSYQ